MTRKLVHTSMAILFLALLGGIAFLWYRQREQKRELLQLNLRCELLARQKPDTIVILRDTTLYFPLPVAPVGLPLSDSTDSITPCPPRLLYDHTFSDSAITIRWKALGNIQWISFPQVTFPFNKTTIIRPVNHVDTLVLCPRKTRLGIYARAFFRDFHSLPGLDAGLQLSFSQAFGLNIGCLRDPLGTYYLSTGFFINVF